MASKRIAYLANIPLKLLPFSEAQRKAYEKSGFVETLAFKTLPSVGKFELKQFLEKVYGLSVARVNTLNYEGKKKVARLPGKSRRPMFYRTAAYKKAYVYLNSPENKPAEMSNEPSAVGKDGIGGHADSPRFFLSFEEKKTAISKQLKRPAYAVNFFLRDNKGRDVLAVVGEDQGDAHYIYKNQPEFAEFGELQCHNRKEVEGYLKDIIRNSTAAAPQTVVEEEVTVDDQGNYHLPSFVSFNKEKKDLPQNQHKWVWYLLDDHGHKHAAVEGLERETRDGHYEYRALEPFSSIQPLSVTSMAKVEDWLDKFLSVRNGRGPTPNMVPQDGHVLPRPASAAEGPVPERETTPLRSWVGRDTAFRGRSPRVNRYAVRNILSNAASSLGQQRIYDKDGRVRAGRSSLAARLQHCPKRLGLDAEVEKSLDARRTKRKLAQGDIAARAVETWLGQQAAATQSALRGGQATVLCWLQEAPDEDTSKYVAEWLQSLDEALLGLHDLTCPAPPPDQAEEPVPDSDGGAVDTEHAARPSPEGPASSQKGASPDLAASLEVLEAAPLAGDAVGGTKYPQSGPPASNGSNPATGAQDFTAAGQFLYAQGGAASRPDSAGSVYPPDGITDMEIDDRRPDSAEVPEGTGASYDCGNKGSEAPGNSPAGTSPMLPQGDVGDGVHGGGQEGTLARGKPAGDAGATGSGTAVGQMTCGIICDPEINEGAQEAASKGGACDNANGAGSRPPLFHLESGSDVFAELARSCPADVSPFTLSEALDGLRELASLHLPLPTLHASGLLATVKSLTTMEEPNLASLAKRTWAQWQQQLGHSLEVVTSSKRVPGPLRPSPQDLLAQAAAKFGSPVPQPVELPPLPQPALVDHSLQSWDPAQATASETPAQGPAVGLSVDITDPAVRQDGLVEALPNLLVPEVGGIPPNQGAAEPHATTSVI
eukprot:jgi/Botrbrau1/4232/Bobra.0044s0027.1